MKIIAIAAIATLGVFTSCNKIVDYFDKYHHQEEELKNDITLTLIVAHADFTYNVKSNYFKDNGFYWSSSVDRYAPSSADDGTYALFKQDESGDTTFGTIQLKIHRNAAVKVDSLHLSGSGSWELLEATGVYSELKKAKGSLKYFQINEERIIVEYDLTGKSN